MPRLDKFIQAMHEHGARSLALHAGKPASLLVGDSTRPVTKEPLTAAQVTMLVKEIAPSQLQPNFTDGASAAFAYLSPSGKVDVELAKGSATIRPPDGTAPPSITTPTNGSAVRQRPHRSRKSLPRSELNRRLTRAHAWRSCSAEL